MKYRVPFLALALGAAGACAGTDVSRMTSPDGTNGRLLAAAALSRDASPRSGSLAVQKNCQSYTGNAGDFCTITASNLAAIPVGTVIIYRSAAVNGILDTDVTLDPPGPGNNTASGHCFVNLSTGLGTCTLDGGTGRFQHLHATADVTPLGGPNFAWNGTYSYDA